MSTITAGAATTAFESRANPEGGFLRRTMAAIAAARGRSGQRTLAIHLDGLGEQRLLDLGFSAADIASIRAGEPVGNILARRASQIA